MGAKCLLLCSSLFLLASLVARVRTESPIVASFRPSFNDTNFAHFVVDRASSTVYVAGKNRLYQLKSSDLSLVAQVATGPRMDSPSCHASGCDSVDRGGAVVESTPTDNYNKILLVNDETQELIVCGSVQQGACELYKLGNISAQPVFIPRRYGY
jgi:hypothetical protein